MPGVGRFRCNVFKQRGSISVAMRRIRIGSPTFEELGLPPVVSELSDQHRGLVLVTGPTGSGKTTTLAAMIDHINNNRPCHILTIEDPIEVLHKDSVAVVNQREVGVDTSDYLTALRAAMREDPDVILIGEMRDMETVAAALAAAETGHFVLSTLHTIDATETVNRIVDFFPPYQQHQIRDHAGRVAPRRHLPAPGSPGRRRPRAGRRGLREQRPRRRPDRGPEHDLGDPGGHRGERVLRDADVRPVAPHAWCRTGWSTSTTP